MAITRFIKNLFLPSPENRFVPWALNYKALAAYWLFTVVTLLSLFPVLSVLPETYRTFFSALSQQLITSQVNVERQRIAVLSLNTNAQLSEAARLKAQDMIARNYFSHIDPDGKVPWIWFDRSGYRYAAAGENLAIDFSDSNVLVRAWLNSPTHAAIIRNPVFTDVGIGIASGTIQGRSTTVAVMFVGRKAATLTTVTATPPPTAPPATKPPAPPPPTPPPTIPPTPPPPAPQPIPPPATPSPATSPTDFTPAEQPYTVRSSLDPQEIVLNEHEYSPGIVSAAASFILAAPPVMHTSLTVLFGLVLLVSALGLARGGSFVQLAGRASFVAVYLGALWLPKIL